jgi:hypothetical protein
MGYRYGISLAEFSQPIITEFFASKTKKTMVFRRTMVVFVVFFDFCGWLQKQANHVFEDHATFFENGEQQIEMEDPLI